MRIDRGEVVVDAPRSQAPVRGRSWPRSPHAMNHRWRHSPPSVSRRDRRRFRHSPRYADTAPPGDIPDNQAFVTYHGAGFSLKVPEGWTRTPGPARRRSSTSTTRSRSSHREARSGPTVANVTRSELVRLKRLDEGFAQPGLAAVSRPAGRGVLRHATRRRAAPSSVTGKRITDDVERYELWRAGRIAVVTLEAPHGSDNVDAWRLVTTARSVDEVSSVLEAVDLYRFYHADDDETLALRGVSLRVEPGEIVAIAGVSGSGKSTLLACLAGLDEPSGGTVRLLGERLSRQPEARRARMRSRSIGMLFQSANLLGAPRRARQRPARAAARRTRRRPRGPTRCSTAWASRERRHALLTELSGGELARAGPGGRARKRSAAAARRRADRRARHARPRAQIVGLLRSAREPASRCSR